MTDLFTSEELAEAQAIARPEFKPGFFKELPAAIYHAIEAMSAGGAKKMIRSPQHFRLMRDQPGEASDAMDFGTVVHAGVLEPDTFASVVQMAPTWEHDYRSKAGKAERAAFAATVGGKIVLSQDDYLRATKCIAAVRSHPIVAKLLADAEGIEESLFWIDQKYNVPCKVRWDIRSRGGLLDLKTARDASPEGFGRACAEYLYHVQEANYRAGAEAVLNESPRFFVFVAAESEPPFACACYYLPPEAVRVGTGLVDMALERYAKALATGSWAGYPQTIDRVPFPRWAMRVNA